MMIKQEPRPITFNLLIAVCSNRDWKPMFGISLINLMVTLTREGINHSLQSLLQTSLLSAGRQMAVEAGIRDGFTHILMLDDDMTFTPDAVKALIHMARDQNYPFVAANYVAKDLGLQGKPSAKGLDDKHMTSVGKTGCEVIKEIGLGMVIVDLGMMVHIPKPWFEVAWVAAEENGQTGSYLGEDYYFCRLLGSEAVPLVVDHDASQQVGHIGDFIYRPLGS